MVCLVVPGRTRWLERQRERGLFNDQRCVGPSQDPLDPLSVPAHRKPYRPQQP